MPLKKIGCATCGFETATAEEFATHMVATGHGLSPGVGDDLKDSGFFAELVEQLANIQAIGPERIDVDPRISSVDLDDPDVPPEVLEALKAIEERQRKK